MEIRLKTFFCSTLLLSMLCASTAQAGVPMPPTAKEAGQEIKKEVPKEVPKELPNDIKKETPSQENMTTDKKDALNELRDEAKVLYNSNKLDEAQAVFSSIPDSEKISDDWLFLANIAQDRDKAVDAVFYLKKAIQIDDKNYKAHYNLGNIYFSDNKANMALDEYRKVLRIKKDYAYAHYNKGCCYLKKKSWFNAKYEFGLAIKANPQEPSFYYNLAYTYKMLKKPKKAQEALDIYNNLMAK